MKEADFCEEGYLTAGMTMILVDGGQESDGRSWASEEG